MTGEGKIMATVPARPTEAKVLVRDMLTAIFAADPADLERVADEVCAPGPKWHFFHPFEPTQSGADAAKQFWLPLREALPNAEYRPFLFLSGEFDNATWVSTLGHVVGSLDAAWLGVPATHGLVFLRMGLNVLVEEQRIARVHVHFDLVDLMWQAGVYPFRRMPGSPAQWPAPPIDLDGRLLDPTLTETTHRIVIDMQESLGFDMDPDNPLTEQHSHLWARDMNWCGPAGIGSTRGEFEYLNYHCAPLESGFPDLTFPFQFDGQTERGAGRRSNPNHYIQLSEGQQSVTGGWPSLAGTHTGPGFLGLPATGREVRMRVADWYRVDDHGKIADNWIMIDIPDIVQQCGLDMLEDLRHVVDPTLNRWVPMTLTPRHR